MNFGENLLKYAKSISIASQKELAKKVQENEKTISSYTTEKSYPTYKKLVKICNLLQCDPNTLMQGDFEYDNDSFPTIENEVLSKYNNLTPHDKEIVDYILNMKDTSVLPKPIKVQEVTKIIYKFPVYEQKAAAGVGQLGRDGNYKMKEYIVDNIPEDAVYAMNISGESMNHERTNNLIHTGSIVLINPKFDEYELSDKIVIANFKGKVICKRYINKGDYILFQSDNDAYKEENRKSKDDPDCKVLGIVLGVIKDNTFISLE